MNSGTDIPIIAGPGVFDIEVESRHQQTLLSVVGPRTEELVDVVVKARLRLDDMNPVDRMAVAVSVNDQLVGYLPRVVAEDFRRAVIEGDLTEYRIFECQGRIRQGRSSDSTGEGAYSVWLDLPQDDECRLLGPSDARTAPDLRIPVYRHAAVADRQIDELIGIVKGVMADGMVTHGEVDFLLRWMEANRHAANLWPAKALYPRLAQVAAEGFMNLHEEGEMLELLMKAVGGNTAPMSGFASDSTKLPLTEPIGPLTFDGRAFCFTGTFHSGTRDWCHSQVAGRGGRYAGNISKKLDYLVIGDIGNETWAHSTYGRKIEKAIQYNSAGCTIAIVSEEHWYSHL